MNRPRTIVAIAVAFAITGIGGVLAFQSLQRADADGETQPLNLQSATSLSNLNPNGSELVVRTYTIGSDSEHMSESTFTGTLQPRYTASIGFRIAGKILERHVELGQRFKKGDVLFQLDPDDTELQLRVAEAEHLSAKSLLTQAVAEQQRQAQLRNTGSASQSEYDLATATLAVASARLDSAERRLTLAKNQRAYCDLVADSDGLVLSIQAEAGQVVNIGQPVLQVMQKSELEAVVNLPEGFELKLRDSQASVRFWSLRNTELRAELRELSPIADPTTRTYAAKFRLIDSVDELAIGMTATVVLQQADSDRLEIPLTCVSERNDSAIVWRIVDAHQVDAVPVELVQYKSETVIIRGPLMTGDRIVSAGVQRIDENVTVRVWEGS